MEALLMPDRLHLDLPDAPRKPGVGVFGDVFFFLHVCVYVAILAIFTDGWVINN